MAINACDRDLWIRHYLPAPDAATRLVCFPHAGGSASFYVPVSRALSPAVDVLAIQYPGRQDRRTEPCIEDIGELADRVVDVLPAWHDRPLAFFGHSMGATLAFEVARRLEASGLVVAGLFVSGRRAPSRPRTENVHQRSDEHLLDELKKLSGTDPRLFGNDEVLRMVLPAIRSDYKAAETYRFQPGAKLTCPIFAFVGDNDPKVTIGEARSWEDHTRAEFTLQVFTGGHFYLGEHQSAVLSAIRERLGSLPDCADSRLAYSKLAYSKR